MTILADMWGPAIGALGLGLLCTSVLSAQSSFHGYAARYVYALGRERVLPKMFAAVTPGRDGGAPKAGSFTQAGISALVLTGFVATGTAPLTMFVWLSTIGAVCVLALLTLSSWSAVHYLSTVEGAGVWVAVQQILAGTGAVLGVLALLFMLSNLSSLLGVSPDSALPWQVGGTLFGTVVAIALIVGAQMKSKRPQDYHKLGQGTPNPLLQPDARYLGRQL